MNEFPKLKTGAIAQYPLERQILCQTWIGRFVDGSEQRFREVSGPVRRWVLNLALLQEDEASTIRSFFAEMEGRHGTFSFEDPFDGTIYPNCHFEADELELEWEFDGRATARLVISEERV